MPRRVTLSEVFAGTPAKTLFSLMYGDGEFLSRYHAEVNGCVEPGIEGFEEVRGEGMSRLSMSRLVTFSFPVKAPGVVMRLVGGSDRVEVLERQTVRVCGENNESVVLTSQPRPQLGSLGDGFTSDAEIWFVDEDGGCRVEAAVDVAAMRAPYGTVSLIESFMADTALASLEGLLELMRARYEGLVRVEGMVEEVVRRNVLAEPALHSYLGVGDMGVGMDMGDMGDMGGSTGEDAPAPVFYDDRNEEVLLAVGRLSDEVARLVERVERMQGVMMRPKEEVVRVSVRVDVMPLVMAGLVTMSCVAGTLLLSRRLSR